MARNRQPILKKCRALGIDPTVLGVIKNQTEVQDRMQIQNQLNMQFS